MNAWVAVAEVLKTKNLHGRLVVRGIAGLPFLLEEGQEVFFVPPRLEGLRSARIEELRMTDEVTAEVLFEGLDSLEDARALVGRRCLVARADIEAKTGIDPGGRTLGEEGGSQADTRYGRQETSCSPLSPWDATVLSGYGVHDESEGFLGYVEAVRIGPHQSLLEVVDRETAVMIPFVDEFVLNIDHEAKTLATRIPSGLLEL